MSISCPKCGLLIYLESVEEKSNRKIYEIFCDDCGKTWKVSIEPITDEFIFTIQLPLSKTKKGNNSGD